MSTASLIALALTMMNTAQPEAPWKDTYPSTAAAFARSAEETPLFDGESGPERTVALYVSLAWFEGTFKPDALGDKGRSLCTFQINESNLAWLGMSREQLLTDINACTDAANRMIRRSFRVCRTRTTDERLGWYAAGGRNCDRGLAQSRHRMRKAQWLFAHVRSPSADFLALDP